MVGQHGIKLAVYVISTHFGEHVSKVCDCLLWKGILSLTDITQYTELASKVVENCLLVLIQHNCVQASCIPDEGGSEVAPGAVAHYTVIFDNILHHLRFPKFLAILSEEQSKEGVEILDVLFQHGRLTLQQILSKKNEGNLEALEAIFFALVDANYIEPCPTIEPNIAPVSEDNCLSTRKRGPKSAKLTGNIEAEEQRSTMAETPIEVGSFSVMTKIVDDIVSDAVIGVNPPNKSAGEKRKHESIDLVTNANAVVSEKEIFWRANFEEFVHRLRQKAIVANARTWLDDGAAAVLNAVLEATWRTYGCVKEANSVPLSINAILEEVMRIEGRTMTVDHVRATLKILEFHPSTTETDEEYTVDLKKFIESAQNDEIGSIILKRYGRDTHRVFRLLAKTNGLVHTNKISDITLFGKKETLKILNDLRKNEYLNMEKITIQGFSQLEVLLWEVNRSSIQETILDEMYHTAINLCLRRDDEKHKLTEKRTEAQKKIDVLESSLMKVDDALMLFHDFL